MSLNAYEHGERDAGFVLGSAASPCLAWLAGTAAGSVLGGYAPNPRVLGLDFMLIAFSAAMMVGMFRQKSDWGVVAIAVVAALGVAWLGSPAWAPVIAGIAGGLSPGYASARPHDECRVFHPADRHGAGVLWLSVAGFVAMRFVTITPRIEAALRATPLSVMAGIVAVAAMRGGPASGSPPSRCSC